MMGAFLGSQGGDLRDLMQIQLVLVPISIGVTLWLFLDLARLRGVRGAIRALAVVPGWLLFAVCAVNSVVLIAELSFVLIHYHTNEPAPWQEHLPAASAFFASIAFLLSYARYRLARD